MLARVGALGFSALWGACLLGGATGFALLTSSPAPMVGASGALFGLAGAWLVGEIRRSRGLRTKVLRIDTDNNLMVVRGAVPGANGGYVLIRKAVAAKPEPQPQLQDKPSVGTLAVVDGMAGVGFLMEMDAIAARPTGAGRTVKVRPVPFDKPGTPAVRSLRVGDRVIDGSVAAKLAALRESLAA